MDLGSVSEVSKFPKSKNAKKNKQVVLVGKGDYKQVLKEVGSALKPVAKQALLEAGGALGGMAGSRLGSASAGSKVGRGIAARISKMFGCGDYVVSEKPVVNSLIEGSRSVGYASFGTNSQSVRVKHREFLFDLAQGSVAGVFTNKSVAINPGLAGTFPYLAPIAANFEEYVIRGLVFEYISTTSPYFAAGAMGSIIMSMSYNPTAPAYVSKPQMENSEFAISARPDQTMVYGVECASNSQNMYMVRQGSSSAPLTSTDLGNFQIAIQSAITAGTVVGEVWVSYDIELLRPKTQTSIPGFLHVNGTGLGSGTFPTTVNNAHTVGMFTGISSTLAGNVLSIKLPSLPPTQVLSIAVERRYVGATAAVASASISGTGLTGLTAMGNGLIVDGQASSGVSAIGSDSFTMLMTATSEATIAITFPAAPTGATSQTYDVLLSSVGYGTTDV